VRVVYTVTTTPREGYEPETKTLELPPPTGPILIGCSSFVFEGETYPIVSSRFDLDAGVLTIYGGQQSG
jgi:hypothetical protein